MARTEEVVKEKYKKYLDPMNFRDFKLNGLKDENARNDYDFYLKCLYEFFSTGDFSGNSSLLDLGSGPTVHNVASASCFINYIVLSDLVEANCEELNRWLKNKPGCLDWKPFIKRVALAEGKSGSDAICSEIEDRIRQAVKRVVQCDVLANQVLPFETRQKTYDVILSAFTFETAAVSKQSFSEILGRIRSLLKPGGKLVLIGPIETTYWNVGDKRFHCLYLRQEDIHEALEENSYGDIRWQLRNRHDGKLLLDCSNSSLFAGTDCTKFYFLSCTKF